MKMVKAAVMEEPGRMVTREFPYPEMKPGALILKVELSGICGTDKHIWQGETHFYAGSPGDTQIPFPVIPGHEIVGVVADITKEAVENLEYNGQKLREGDRVTICPDVLCGKCYFCRHTFGYGWCENGRAYGHHFSTSEWPALYGGWAEYLYVRPDVITYKVPETIPPEVAVLTEPMVCTWALDEAKACYQLDNKGFGAGDTVVVLGQGPLGLLFTVKAQILGAGMTIVTDASVYRLEMAKRFGVDHAMDVRSTTAEERIQFVKKMTGGLGASVVVGCVNTPSAFVEGLEMLRKGGTFVEVGNFIDVGPCQINVHRHFVAKNIHLIGRSNHPVTHYAQALRLFEKYSRTFPFQTMVTDRFAIGKAGQAMEKSVSLECMKVAIDPAL
jgi:L-iditol 2-dehydrogenase